MLSSERKPNVVTLLLAFSLGVLLTLLVTSGPDDRYYVPFGPTGEKILDTRNGQVYAQTGGMDTWHVLVRKVGRQ